MSTKTIIGISLIIIALLVGMIVFLVIWETITESIYEPTRLIPVDIIVIPTLQLLQDKIEVEDKIELLDIDIETTNNEIDNILEAIKANEED